VSGADGYFVLPGVVPGTYQLRIAPGQLQRLGLHAPAPRHILLDDAGNFVSGQDIVVTRENP
jgi:hypothetical protein